MNPEHMPFASKEDLSPIFTSIKAQAWHDAAVLLQTSMSEQIARGKKKHLTKRRLRKLEGKQHILDHVVPSLFQKAQIIERNARKH